MTATDGVVLLTAGTRGIGRAIVDALVAAGHPVAFTWRSDEAAAERVMEETGGRATGFHFDVKNRMNPSLLVSQVEERCGGIFGLVNNAGMRKDKILPMIGDVEWDEMLDVNLSAAFRMCRAVVPGMVSRRRGSIVSISSLSAIHGVAGQSAYAAAKAGLIGMTRALAREVGRRNIRVNAVVPGFVMTAMTAELPPEAVTALRSAECVPYGTPPESVAGTVAFLMSDAAKSITGQSIVVDAGNSA